MNFYLPDLKAVFMAENANATIHNLLPARGALVRDAKAWADYLTEAIRLFADKSNFMFAAHGIPRFGQEEIRTYLENHRDAYKFIHDQSVRLMNAGLTGNEIAETIELPDVLGRHWYNRSYYGGMKNNAKAVYQMYMGWYDGNPVHLDELPPEEASAKYVESMGGKEAAFDLAKEAKEQGELRWASMVLNHLIFAKKGDDDIHNLLAEIYTLLAYQSEAAVPRNCYLVGAQELRNGVYERASNPPSPQFFEAITTSMLFNLISVRFNHEKVMGKTFSILFNVTDRKEKHLIQVRNQVLVHEVIDTEYKTDLVVTLQRKDLVETLIAGVPLKLKTVSGAVKMEGDAEMLKILISAIEQVDENFNIITP